ncbi:MAG TPA: ATP-binding cassette domain-containing protein [Burkholderiaceae bacterium]|nr:ATP-binding cassette domain-containing protein [Burkholderiaceae bacterium]
MIEAHDLWKAFGATQAVAGVSFAAHDGQITGLLGPNGAGKTTTLRMLYTLMRPDRGQIRVDGIDAASAPMQVRQRIGALPDARGLYKRLTARENVEYFARLHGMSAAQARERCSELLRALQMQTLADRRVEGFSQGERVKTAIARALVHNPRNVILDEPANGLDVMANRGLREVLRNLRAEGRCVLMSTHIMQEVIALCDRIVIIAYGRVVADGTPEALREHSPEHNLEDAFMKIIGAAALESGA